MSTKRGLERGSSHSLKQSCKSVFGHTERGPYVHAPHSPVQAGAMQWSVAASVSVCAYTAVGTDTQRTAYMVYI